MCSAAAAVACSSKPAGRPRYASTYSLGSTIARIDELTGATIAVTVEEATGGLRAAGTWDLRRVVHVVDRAFVPARSKGR